MASAKASAGRAVALLRGVNVGGRHKLPMADLRAMALGLGWRDVATHVQSGNLVGTIADLGRAAPTLAKAIEAKFGFEAPVLVRSGSEFVQAVAACPFPDGEPARVHLGIGSVAAAPSLPKALAPYCAAGERVAVRGGFLWIDYVGGVARSKLTSAVLDRALGGVVTLRNLTSARAIAALVGGDG